MDAFTDKVAIVTGGASGIGCALCKELSRQGAMSIVADINIEGAQQVVASITKAGGRARAVQVDVSQVEDLEKIIRGVAFEYGRLDYIFNNAGIALRGEVRDMSLEHWRRIIDVNLLGVLYGATTAYSLMVNQGHGHIVNIASILGLINLPTYTAYTTTKHAVVGFSASLRAEGAGLGVKVSVVCPGYIKTAIRNTTVILQSKRELHKHRLRERIERISMDATQAAKQILKSVSRNQAIIIFPFRTRLIWWLYRIQPALFAPVGSMFIKNFRTSRSES